MVAFNSTLIRTSEVDGAFQVCVYVVDQTIDDGVTISLGYTLQDGPQLCKKEFLHLAT